MLRVVVWNVRRAIVTSKAWLFIEGLDADLVLLQEVGGIPHRLRERYCVHEMAPSTRSGSAQRFTTAILAKGALTDEVLLESDIDWINRERDWFGGCIVARRVQVTGRQPINVVSFYSPPWAINRLRLEGIDATSVRLENNPDIWCTEVLWSLLRHSMGSSSGPWIVGGDFNSSETFDAWRVGGRGNRQIIERMNALGLTDCLRSHHGRLVPTFRNPRGGKIVHQIDHLYVSEPLLSALKSAVVAPAEIIFDQRLSDHLPIIADFESL